ncbi:MAG: hypothetical protein KOO60_12320 [Gemmatimonadales bacterium]|nr:hypothetical protein [Gemmatimonadales bacterium]
MSHRNKLIFIAVALILGSAAQAAILEYSLDRMVESSEAIVRGRVMNLESRWLDGPGSVIVTDVVFLVDEVLTGEFSAPQQLNFYVVGGVVDGLGLRQEHQPVFHKDEESVLFLWTQPDQNRLAVFNDEQGRYRLVGDTVVNFKQQSIALPEFREELDWAIQIHKR